MNIYEISSWSSPPSSPNRLDEEKGGVSKEMHKKINSPRVLTRPKNLSARKVKAYSTAVNLKEPARSFSKDPSQFFSVNLSLEEGGITEDLMSRHHIEIRCFNLKKNAEKNHSNKLDTLFQKKYFNKISLGGDVFLDDYSVDFMVETFVKEALDKSIKGLNSSALVLDQIDNLCSELAYTIFKYMTQTRFLERQLDRTVSFFLNCMWSSIRESNKKTNLIIECFDLTNILVEKKMNYLELMAEVKSKITGDEKDKKKWILKSLLLAINPKEQIALNVVTRIEFWNNLRIDEIRRMISSNLMHLIRTNNISRRIFTPHFINVNDEMVFSNDRMTSVDERIKCLLLHIDLEQVARSYLQNELNYNAIHINKIPVNVANLKGSEQERQFFFYQNFIEILYREGLFRKEKIEVNIKKESKKSTEKFLQQEKNFLGCDILCIGSNSAWSLCDKVIRQLFPALFKPPFSARVQQGTECSIHILNPDTYSIEVKKTYCTYNLLYPEDHSSFVIEKRKLCAIEFLWSVYYKRKTWSMKIQILRHDRLEANDQEWNRIVEIINHYHYFDHLGVHSRKRRKVSLERPVS